VIRAKIEANPFCAQREEQEAADPDDYAKARTTACSTTSRRSKETLGDYIDTLHFDEAWLPHATFHDFYKNMHAIGRDRPRPEGIDDLRDALDPQAARRDLASIAGARPGKARSASSTATSSTRRT